MRIIYNKFVINTSDGTPIPWNRYCNQKQETHFWLYSYSYSYHVNIMWRQTKIDMNPTRLRKHHWTIARDN